MKASVVIPAHNEEKDLALTLTAVLAQDYPDLEVIVVDNASTDKTADIAASFTGVKVVHEARKGLLMARERGRNEASGDIIVNMDADCLPESDHISRGMKHFTDHKVIAVTGPYDYYDGHRLFRAASLGMQRYIYHPISLILQLPFIKGGAVLIGGNNMIRADILRKAGGYDVSIAFYGEDTDTAKRVARHGIVRFDPALSMKTSARRFKTEGFCRITFKYLYHFWKTIFSR